jgi:hypothetical protein
VGRLQALCFGWIDAVRKRVDDRRYVIRFTPRRRNSIWSSVNVARVKQLTEVSLMQPAGVVISAKKEETRLRRLATLIEDSAHQRAIKPLVRNRSFKGTAG